MPITVEIVTINGDNSTDVKQTIDSVFDYFKYVDLTFSTYKEHSEIMKINRGEIKIDDASKDMKEIFRLSEETKKETNGYFDIKNRKGIFDPSGIVKGWAILNAANIVKKAGYKDYYVEAGGDIQVSGNNDKGENWTVGIRNPFNIEQIVKVLKIKNEGVATSGTYERGQHIYNPKNKEQLFTDIVSLTVIGPNVYEADRFATAAFAMGRKGIEFIERLRGFHGYLIDSKGVATMTTGVSYYE